MTDKEYFEIWTDCWRLFRRYMNMEPVSRDEYWRQFLNDVSAVHDKHRVKFCERLLLCVMDEIELICEERSKEG